MHASIYSYVKISLVHLSMSFFVKRFGFVMLNKNQKYDTSKEYFYPLMFVSNKHTCKHDMEYKKGYTKPIIIATLPFGS